MDTQIIEFLTQHKWIALAAVVINLIVRLLKSDTKIPIDIPAAWRAPLALALGAAAGALSKLVESGNTSWRDALTQGAAAAVLAILAHVFLVGSARGGREITIPGLIKPNTPPGPGKPPSIPPAAGAGLLMTFALVMVLNSCALFSRENAPKTILTLEQIACIIQNAFLDDANLNAICKLLTGQEQEAAAKLASTTRASMKSSAPLVCSPDGGAEAGK
jgi:hypothetical protein